MTTLTIKISDKKNAKMLYQMLSALAFVEEIDMHEDITEGEKQLLEERLVEYKKSPRSGKSLDSLVKELSKKYGFESNR